MPYIDKDKTIKAVRDKYFACDTDTDYARGIQQGFDFAMSIIRNQPTADVVKVVRCKDCKHRRKFNDTWFYCEKTYADLSGWHKRVDDDFYCADGERKEAEETE